ncbi:alpha-xylosidase [Clostridium fessum]|uniref:glycoside hydrolase family 31 protein n=1 Tax=Clostridium fessum TaxID=2126740 RepID=UPI002A7FB8AC|nr:TIM-barrel domain-containing protein [Clostridium fessum]MDY4928165.1 glycoside hydrolase family 31 protein [Clostridium fessum]
MKVDYNPQVGYRRTVFEDHYDFLLKPVSFAVEENCLRIAVETYRGERAEVKVCFLTDTVFRLQMIPQVRTGRKGNPVFTPEQRIHAELLEQEHFFEFGTGHLTLHFCKDYWELSVYEDGKLLTKEQVFDTNVDNRWKVLPIGWHCDGQGNCCRIHETMYLHSDEAFWGFGEKFTDLNKRGQLLHCWQKDALSTNTEDSYKAHPFFVSSRGYAILLNTYTRCSFDMGHTSQVSYQMEAEDGCLDYIFIGGGRGDYKALLSQYVQLTGAIPLIPKWAFGFWMSRCSYQSRQEIEEVVLRCEKGQLPIRVIHIDGWQKQEYTGAWVWDEERFPDPEGMIRWLHAHGVRLSLWIFPYLAETSPLFAELAEKGYFVKNKDGAPALFYSMADADYRSACFDFSNPEFLAWYKPRVMRVLRMGVNVIKTDFSEAVPEEAIYYDGKDGVEGHNRLTYLYAETLYRWMEECTQKTGELPMLWGRSGYAGSHRIPAAWAGDSSSARNNHAAIVKGGLSLAMSGVAFWGFDMGGFYNTGADGNECPPTKEEYLRSLELGFFMPLSRAHGKTPREPWHFGEKVLEIVRKFDRIRNGLLPYLTSTAVECHLKGLPMLRPLFLEFPNDPIARYQELSYMLGSALLIAPPFDRDRYDIYLPQGKWVDYFTGEVFEGGRFITVEPGIDELPVFQRENTCVLQMGEGDTADGYFHDLKADIFYTGEMEQTLYDYDAAGKVRTWTIRLTADDAAGADTNTALRAGDLRIVTDAPIREAVCICG